MHPSPVPLSISLDRANPRKPRDCGNGQEEMYRVSNYEAMQRLAERYISDAAFRAEMTSDPEGTAKRYGVSLDSASRQTTRVRSRDNNEMDGFGAYDKK